MSRRRYTPEERAEIVAEHLVRHGGVVNTEKFLLEAADPEHPAHAYFEWDNSDAAHQFRLSQVRRFVIVERPSVVERTIGTVTFVPNLVSPMSERRRGGGYIEFDTPDGQTELRSQALLDGSGLRAWLRRFRCVLEDDEIVAAEELVEVLHGRIVDSLVVDEADVA